MKYIIKKQNNKSIINNDENLILSIYFGEVNVLKVNSVIEYSKDDQSVLNICFDYYTNELDYLSLIIIKDIEIKDSNYRFDMESFEGTIFIDKKLRYPLFIESNIFNVILFNDSIIINLSENKEKIFVKTGNVIFSFDNNFNLINIRILNLTNKQINDIKNKLFESKL